jgi:hypothetical protein
LRTRRKPGETIRIRGYLPAWVTAWMGNYRRD